MTQLDIDAHPARQSWQSETFDRIYAANPDPWSFTSSRYERAKYAATLAALGGRRYAAAFEGGCSIGVFTRMLARRCGTLLAADVAEAALRAARQRCRGMGRVRFERRSIPAQWPRGPFDLIVLSEVLYFLSPADIARAAAAAVATLRPGGRVLLVNFTGTTDTPCSGDEAADRFARAAARSLRPALRWRRPGYRLDLLVAR